MNTQSHIKSPRNNQELAVVHHNAADLLKRVQTGRLQPNDRALAGIIANALEKRKN